MNKEKYDFSSPSHYLAMMEDFRDDFIEQISGALLVEEIKKIGIEISPESAPHKWIAKSIYHTLRIAPFIPHTPEQEKEVEGRGEYLSRNKEKSEDIENVFSHIRRNHNQVHIPDLEERTAMMNKYEEEGVIEGGKYVGGIKNIRNLKKNKEQNTETGPITRYNAHYPGFFGEDGHERYLYEACVWDDSMISVIGEEGSVKLEDGSIITEEIYSVYKNNSRVELSRRYTIGNLYKSQDELHIYSEYEDLESGKRYLNIDLKKEENMTHEIIENNMNISVIEANGHIFTAIIDPDGRIFPAALVNGEVHEIKEDIDGIKIQQIEEIRKEENGEVYVTGKNGKARIR